MSIERPDGLTEPCPSWCGGDHTGQELLADRRHESDYLVIPIIQRRDGYAAPEEMPEGDELTVVAARNMGARETWVAIANDRQHVEISPECAERLHAALGTLLARMAGSRA